MLLDGVLLSREIVVVRNQEQRGMMEGGNNVEQMA